ncbi:MAG: hypothetical protein RR889_08385, partial [Akkermansia sp.]
NVTPCLDCYLFSQCFPDIQRASASVVMTGSSQSMGASTKTLGMIQPACRGLPHCPVLTL